jgi:hypothetical protein
VSVDPSEFDPFEWARRLHEWGSEDPGFDLLMGIGPLVVLAFTVGGRSPLTTVLASAYVSAFVVVLAWNALSERR